jgi:hypothetical protein
VANCLTLEREGVPVVPRSVVKSLPTIEECLIMDLSTTRSTPTPRNQTPHP